MADQRPPQREQTPLDDQRAKLYGTPAQPSHKRPVMTFGYVGKKYTAGCASITVKTNVPDDKNYGKIEAVIPMAQLYGVFEQIRNLTKLEGAQERSTRLFTDFMMGKKTDTPVAYANLIVGKEEDGRVYIALISRNRPAFKFYMCPDDFFRCITNGEEMNTAEFYAWNAVGYVNMIQGIFDNLVTTKFVPWVPDNGGNGGGNKNNNYSGGNQNSGGGNNGGGNSGGGNGGWGGNDGGGSGDLWE